MSIADLIEAAHYLERREREAEEHGYAASPSSPSSPLLSPSPSSWSGSERGSPSPSASSSSASSSASTGRRPSGSTAALHRLVQPHNLKKASIGFNASNRSSHNELEKNRRAHLRDCLERLKSMVPTGNESSRHTTLGLLKKAQHFIRSLEDKERKTRGHKELMLRQQKYLRRRLLLLSAQVDAMSKRRSVSESSFASNTSSSASESDDHESDLMGVCFGGANSDDDRCSIGSGASCSAGSSDGGTGSSISSWTKQLTLMDEEQQRQQQLQH